MDSNMAMHITSKFSPLGEGTAGSAMSEGASRGEGGFYGRSDTSRACEQTNGIGKALCASGFPQLQPPVRNADHFAKKAI